MARPNPALRTLAVVAASAAMIAAILGMFVAFGARATDQGGFQSDDPSPEFLAAVSLVALVFLGVTVVVGTGWLAAHAVIRHLAPLEAATVDDTHVRTENPDGLDRASHSNPDAEASV